MRRRDLLPKPTPFALRREDAAAYCGLSPVTFDRAVTAGELPQPRLVGGCKVWPRPALENALAGYKVEGVNTCDADQAFG